MLFILRYFAKINAREVFCLDHCFFITFDDDIKVKKIIHEEHHACMISLILWMNYGHN